MANYNTKRLSMPKRSERKFKPECQDPDYVMGVYVLDGDPFLTREASKQYSEDASSIAYPKIPKDTNCIDLSNRSLSSFFCVFDITRIQRYSDRFIKRRMAPIFSAISVSSAKILIMDGFDFTCENWKKSNESFWDDGEYRYPDEAKSDISRCLQKAKISNLSLRDSPEGGYSLRPEFLEGLAKNKTIITADFSGTSFSSVEAKHVANFIKKNTALLEIDFTKCKMNDKAWKKVADALMYNPKVLVRGHNNPFINTAEMQSDRKRLLEVCNLVANTKLEQCNDTVIVDAINNFSIIEYALGSPNLLEVEEHNLPINVESNLTELLIEARLRGIEIPSAILKEHQSKISGKSLIAKPDRHLKIGILDSMIRASRSVDDEVNQYNQIVDSITNEILKIVERENLTQTALDDAKVSLKQAERDATRMDRKIDGMIDIKRVEGDSAFLKYDALNQADAWLSIETAKKEQMARAASKILWEGGIALATQDISRVQGVGNAIGDMTANLVGEHMRIRNRREMRRIELELDAYCREEIIDILESQRIDVALYQEEVEKLAKKLEGLARSKEVEKIRKSSVEQQRIASGLLRQRLIKSGLDICLELINFHLKPNNIESIDAFIDSLHDTLLSESLRNLCFGRAKSNDIEIIIAESNALNRDISEPPKVALKSFVEEYLKPDIDGFITKASFNDAIDSLKLIDLETMSFHGQIGDVQNNHRESGELLTSLDLDVIAKCRAIIMSAFAEEYGVQHISNYYIRRLFRFWLTRHGDTTLVADEILDGNKVRYNELIGKEVRIEPEIEMRRFTEAVKRGGANYQNDMPIPENLFLRVCAYEYYLPQAVYTSSDLNKLSDNPEAPIAYPMVNKVVSAFLEKFMVGKPELYRDTVGARLDNVITQSFFDFFVALGREHKKQFHSERESLRVGFGNDLYTRHFVPHLNRITSSALKRYDLFAEVYSANLEKYMQVLTTYERMELEEQVYALKDRTDDILNPKINIPGSEDDRARARQLDHTLMNVTECFV